MKDRFDLEQNIMAAWTVIDDIKDLNEYIHNSSLINLPASQLEIIKNHLFAMSTLHDMKFQKLWSTFEELVENGKIS